MLPLQIMLHEFCLKMTCADISQIKMDMFADKKYNKEIVSAWLVETIKQLKQSYDVLKLSTGEIYHIAGDG